VEPTGNPWPALSAFIRWLLNNVAAKGVMALVSRYLWEPLNQREDRRMGRLQGQWTAALLRREDRQVLAEVNREAAKLLERTRRRPDAFVPRLTRDERQAMVREQEADLTPKMKEHGWHVGPIRDTSLYEVLARLSKTTNVHDLTELELTEDVVERVRSVSQRRGHEKFEMQPTPFALRRFLYCLYRVSRDSLWNNRKPRERDDDERPW
jgi:hypothetical protein